MLLESLINIYFCAIRCRGQHTLVNSGRYFDQNANFTTNMVFIYTGLSVNGQADNPWLEHKKLSKTENNK